MEQGADGEEITLSLAGAGASFGAVLDSDCGDDNEAGCLVSGQASCFLGSVVGQVSCFRGFPRCHLSNFYLLKELA